MIFRSIVSMVRIIAEAERFAHRSATKWPAPVTYLFLYRTHPLPLEANNQHG